MNDLCSIELLKSALAGNLSADEETCVAEHLEHCESCSAAIENLAAEPAFCQEAAKLLAADALDEALPVREDWSLADFGVEFLEPTDDSGHLGRLGGYDIIQVIGRGGMGVVLKAFDPDLKRSVAIKVLAPHLAHSSLARKRFAREAQAAAAVVHPHVLAIHQVQSSGRLPFIVMPLVAGESLAERLATRGLLELNEVLRIGMQAAAGLAAAHEQGLVHRDVKPANILLERGIERAVLTDFGLARAADDVAMTRWGIIAGTPQYMSPEQARGESLDHRSDLFSLGCILYEMATGVSPFNADSTIATIRRLVDETPRPPSSYNPELPHWFVQIVDRLLEKDPSGRFGSATEVSELLAGCLAHVQQPATTPLPAGLVHPPITSRLSVPKSLKIGVLVMLATIVMIFAGMFAMQTESPLEKRRDAGSRKGVPSESPVSEEPAKTAKATNSGPKRLRQFVTPVDAKTIACSADGKLIGIANGNPTMILLANGRSRVEGNWRPSVVILDSQTGETLASLSVTSAEEEKLLEAAERAPHFEIEALAFSPDASVLAIGTNVGQVKLFKARTGELVRSLDDGQGKLSDNETPEEFHSLPRAMGNVAAIAFSPDGNLLATCGGSFGDFPLVAARIERGGLAGKGTDRLKVWDVKSGALKHTLTGHRHAHAVAFSPDGKLLASAGRWSGDNHGNGVILWNSDDGSKLRALSTPDNGGTHSVAFSPDGKLLAIGSIVFDKDKGHDAASGLITLARAGSGIVEWQRVVPGWAKPVAFSPDGKSVAILHGQKTITFVDPETGKSQHETNVADTQPDRRWIDFAFSGNSRLLAIGGVDKEKKGSVELWDLGGLAAGEADSPKATKLLRERVELIFADLKAGNAKVDEAVRACKDLAEVEPAEATKHLMSLLAISESLFKAGNITKADLLSVQAAYELAKQRAK